MRCVIIGAGPAGSVAAAVLAGGGVEVILVEQHSFPRDKVCGECLSALGLEVLGRLGLADRLLAGGGVALARTILHDRDGRQVAMDLPRACHGVSRNALDTLLLNHARSQGAVVLQPARCEGMTGSRGGGVRVRVRDLLSNQVATLAADYALLADGKSALMDGRPARTGDLGVKARFEDVEGPRDAVELFALEGHYVGLNPIEGGRWNLAMSVPAERVRAMGGDLQAVFAGMLAQNAGLARRFARARRVSDWLAAPLPRFAVQTDRWPAGVIPIGNAAAALEPIGGEGMGLAMRSAELAAEAILCRHRLASRDAQPVSFGELAPAFARLWRSRRAACRAAAVVLSRPALATPALELLGANAPLQQAALALIGK